MPGLWRLRWLGFGLIVAFFFLAYFVPAITLGIFKAQPIVAQALDIAAFIAVDAWLIRWGIAWAGRAGWTARHTAALITGALTFPMLLSLLLPQARALLEPAVTLPFFALLVAIEARLRRLQREASG